MMLTKCHLYHGYIQLPQPPSVVAQEVFLAGLGQTELPLPAPPQGYFLLLVPSAEGASTYIHTGLLAQGGCKVSLGGDGPEYLYAVLGGRLTEAFLSPFLARQGGEIPLPTAASAAGLLRRTLHAMELGYAVEGCKGSALAYELLMELLRQGEQEQAAPSSTLAGRAAALMEEDFSYLYGVEEVAQALEVSKSHLIRMFSAEMGISPGKYLTQVRIERVKLLLQAGGYSLDAIAAMTGFAGANYLCKVFRKLVGMPPGQYARLMRPAAPDEAEVRQLRQLEQVLYF